MEGLPVAPFMDREKVTKPTAQVGFIKFVLIPMFETLAKVRQFTPPLGMRESRVSRVKIARTLIILIHIIVTVERLITET